MFYKSLEIFCNMSTKKLVTYYTLGLLGWGLVHYSLNSDSKKTEPMYFNSTYNFNLSFTDDMNYEIKGLEEKILVESSKE